MAVSCHQGTLVTSDWAADFIPMAMLFAVGHPFILLSILAMCIAGFFMDTAPKLLTYVQFARISAPTINGAVLTMFLRQRRDSHSVCLSHHLTGNDKAVSGFLDSGGSLSGLKAMVASEASVLSFQDAFALCFWVAVAALALLALMTPLKPTPCLRRRPSRKPKQPYKDKAMSSDETRPTETEHKEPAFTDSEPPELVTFLREWRP